MAGRTKTKALFYIGLYVLLCAFLNLLPSYGKPAFRYTGVGPTQDVLHLGWPAPLFIWDPNAGGLQVGPMVYAVIPLQVFSILLVALAGIGARALKRKRAKADEAKQSAEPVS